LLHERLAAGCQRDDIELFTILLNEGRDDRPFRPLLVRMCLLPANLELTLRQ
jgi:hypothetical protein